MKGYIYILKCSDGSYYTGSTVNLESMVYQHQQGKGANFTKTRLPVELVFYEEYDSIVNAFHREKQIQRGPKKAGGTHRGLQSIEPKRTKTAPLRIA